MKLGRQLLPIGVVLTMLCGASLAYAQVAPSLGAAQSYAVLAATTVTNTGSTVLVGDLGVSPGTAITGFPPGTVTGSTDAGNAAAASAQSAATTAYNDLVAQPCTQALTGQDLGGLTLTPGVYCFDTSAQLTGTLQLDTEGDANAVFIFQIGSTLTTASGSSVNIVNSPSACNVFWQVGSSATLGGSTTLQGNVIALTSVTVNTTSDVAGRVLALNGAVSLDSSAVTATCATPPPPVCPAIAIAPTTLPGGTVGLAYSQTIVASGGTGPYGYLVTGGTLPAGLALSTAGALTGTPTADGSFNFTITATDADSCIGTRSYTLLIVAAPPPVCPAIAIAPTTLPGGTVGLAYNQTIVASGGLEPYGFGVTTGVLPAGLALSTAGALTGTPTADGSFNFTITAADADSCIGTRSYTLLIVAAPPPPPVCPAIAIAPTTLPGGTVGLAYSQTIVASGGLEPYGFGVTTGVLPAGIALSVAGALTGTPTGSGSSPFTVTGTDANGCPGTRSYTLLIVPAPIPPPSCPTISIGPATLPPAAVGLVYDQTIVASGGAAPYGFGVSSGTLPAGLTLTSAGGLTGVATPEVPSGYVATFGITATDAGGCSGSRIYTISVAIAVPFMPWFLAVLLALVLSLLGYFRLRRPSA